MHAEQFLLASLGQCDSVKSLCGNFVVCDGIFNTAAIKPLASACVVIGSVTGNLGQYGGQIGRSDMSTCCRWSSCNACISYWARYLGSPQIPSLVDPILSRRATLCM